MTNADLVVIPGILRDIKTHGGLKMNHNPTFIAR
jgi:hypothetical protein